MKKESEQVKFRRVTLTIREDQHELIQEKGLSLSAIVRDLIDDRFSSNKIVLNLTDEGKALYDVVIGGFGSHDVDLEPFFLKALDEYIVTRINLLTKLRKKLSKLA